MVYKSEESSQVLFCTPPNFQNDYLIYPIIAFFQFFPKKAKISGNNFPR